MIEGVNIEYGNIENCKIDTILASKMRWLVTSKKNDGNIQLIFVALRPFCVIWKSNFHVFYDKFGQQLYSLTSIQRDRFFAFAEILTLK